MSIAVMSAVWAINLPASQKIVLLALADAANDDGHCWPGMTSLARKCSKSERTVQAMLVELEAAGHLSRIQNPGKGCNYYVHPRNSRTPAEIAPPQDLPKTPAKSAPKPSRTQKIKNTETRAHVLRDDWEPKQFGPKTKSRAVVDGWPPGELEAQVEHFTAHHRGKGNRFTDWQDAWSTWVLNGRRFTNGRPHIRAANDFSGVRGSRPNPALDMVLQAERDEQAEAERENSWSDRTPRLALPSLECGGPEFAPGDAWAARGGFVAR